MENFEKYFSTLLIASICNFHTQHRMRSSDGFFSAFDNEMVSFIQKITNKILTQSDLIFLLYRPTISLLLVYMLLSFFCNHGFLSRAENFILRSPDFYKHFFELNQWNLGILDLPVFRFWKFQFTVKNRLTGNAIFYEIFEKMSKNFWNFQIRNKIPQTKFQFHFIDF